MLTLNANSAILDIISTKPTYVLIALLIVLIARARQFAYNAKMDLSYLMMLQRVNALPANLLASHVKHHQHHAALVSHYTISKVKDASIILALPLSSFSTQTKLAFS